MSNNYYVALALADTMRAGDSRLESFIEAAHQAFDARLPWVPAMCGALVERTGDNFHHYTGHELADLILTLLGRVESRPDGDDDVDFDQDDQSDEFPWVALPVIKRYCTEPALRPAPAEWLAALALPHLPSVGDLARWFYTSPTEID